MLTFYSKRTPNTTSLIASLSGKENLPYKTIKKNGLLWAAKGKNVITIMLESGQEMGVHPILTPNLYRLREEGIYFSNNYSVNKSNVSEYIGFGRNFPSIPYSFINYKYKLPFTVLIY